MPLSSNRTATLFGDDCSPWLGRIDDPTGLAILHLPWKWMAEVHRWPAIGHEVGHDFYDSVAGLDEELLRRHGLASRGRPRDVVTAARASPLRDVDRIVAHWRHELVADAFGVMMFGPAFVVTTATIFAGPERSGEGALRRTSTATDYDVHPPGHVRVAAVCRLLARMGYGALARGLERGGAPGTATRASSCFRRRRHGGAARRAVHRARRRVHHVAAGEGLAALKGIPLSSMPGFDFGPREHVASLRIRDAFLADERASAGRRAPAHRRRGAGVGGAPRGRARLLRAARLAVGKLPLPVPESPARARERTGVDAELVRDAFVLDLVLAPPRASLLRR